jgi:hypothetical protein
MLEVLDGHPMLGEEIIVVQVVVERLKFHQAQDMMVVLD